jgi:hypothetical protein
VPQEANPEASQQEHEEQSELRLARPMTAAVPGDLNSELESRPMTATCPQPFSFASTAIMMRSRERTARKAREREEELKAQSRFKARPPPKEIYGDQIERAQLKRMHAESAEERARREAEELARLTTFKAKPAPFKIYGDLTQWKEMRQQQKAAAAALIVELSCKDPPPAAELLPWRFTDGTVLRGSDEYLGDEPSPDAGASGSGQELSMSKVGGSLGQRLRDAVATSGAGVHGAGLYGSHEYWEERYARRPLEREGKALFEEWYAPYSAMREVLLPLLKPTDRILHVGCGQSQLGSSLYNDGFCNVLNMDISPAVIAQMAARHAKAAPKMHHRVMDMMALDCCNSSVEMILDKGSIDALMCTGSTQERVKACLSEFLRVLVPNGAYFVVTGQSRTQSFLCSQSSADWTITKTETAAHVGRRPFTVIIMRKREKDVLLPGGGLGVDV